VKTTEASLRKYFNELLETPRIQQYIQDHMQRTSFVMTIKGKVVCPSLRIVDTAGVRYAGIAHSDMAVDISRWIQALERRYRQLYHDGLLLAVVILVRSVSRQRTTSLPIGAEPVDSR